MNIIVMLNNYCIQLKLHWENAVVSSQLTSYSVFFDTTRVDQIILQRQLSNYNNFIYFKNRESLRHEYWFLNKTKITFLLQLTIGLVFKYQYFWNYLQSRKLTHYLIIVLFRNISQNFKQNKNLYRKITFCNCSSAH
jgi:hypothetical protein